MKPSELRIRRMKASVTQFRLASILGVSPSRVSDWENGAAPIEPDEVALLDVTLQTFEDRALISRRPSEGERAAAR